MPKRVRRLFDMDVDEISTVDRAANQHAAIAFSKRAGAEEVTMPIDLYDADGVEVFEDELESGDVVYSDEGDEFVYVAEEDAAEYGIDPDQMELEYEDELEPVGKAGVAGIKAWGSSFKGSKPLERLRGGYGAGRAARKSTELGETAMVPEGRLTRAGFYGGKYRNPLIAGGGVTAVGGGGGIAYGAGNRRRKSEYGKSAVYDELAAALDQADASTAIAKMADYVDDARAQAEQANLRAQAIEDSFVEAEYVSKAGDYDLPVAPQELGGVLHKASQVLSKRDLAILDKALSAAGELSYDEIGVPGGAQPEIMYEIEAYADGLVAKSDLSREEAVVAMFEANPAAYDEYLAEQNGR